LPKLQIFSNSGEVIYSNDPEDIGHINKKTYFHDIVAKGRLYTNMVKKDSKTSDEQIIKSDVMEIYVPLIRDDNRFFGAFEIYYDITARKEKLDKVLFRSITTLVVTSAGLLITAILVLFKASQAGMRRKRAEDALREAHDDLERRVEERTAELSESVMLLIKEVAERKRAEAELQRSEAELRRLSSHLMTAQENERRRISLELHDELGQALSALKLQVGSIQRKLRNDQTALKEGCGETLRYVDETIENVRRLSRDLSPSILEDLGLSAALGWLIEDFTKHHDIKVSADVTNIDNLFSREAQITIYRIFQEALTNIGKHAQATKVSVVVERNGRRVSLLVEDDGKGFDIKRVQQRSPSVKGLGMASMYERVRMVGGILEVSSQERKGTRISFSIPIEEGESGQ
jgi:signal transduction histidine kinase